ncbi:MAG: hypothetical protein GXP56_13950 [Deltaproteobacteria bacterium]|nr:hypothetical protein [Deltaproteobacteria bacterium]
MKRLVYAMFIMLLTIGQLGCQEKKEQVESSQQSAKFEINGLSSPESIVSDGVYYYVSNIGEKPDPMAKDGDGLISKISKDGKIIQKGFIEGLNAPKGMAIIDGTIYATDIDRVAGFDLKTKEKKLEIIIDGTVFLNDLTVLNNNSLIVSATDINKLFELDLGKSSYSEIKIAGQINGPNGIWYDKNKNQLYVCGMGVNNKPNGSVGIIDLSTNQYKALTDYTGMLDGLALIDQSTVLFSNWVALGPEGIINKLNIDTKEITKIDLQGIAGPADFYYNNETKQLWIPELLENKILVVTIDR